MARKDEKQTHKKSIENGLRHLSITINRFENSFEQKKLMSWAKNAADWMCAWNVKGANCRSKAFQFRLNEQRGEKKWIFSFAKLSTKQCIQHDRECRTFDARSSITYRLLSTRLNLCAGKRDNQCYDQEKPNTHKRTISKKYIWWKWWQWTGLCSGFRHFFFHQFEAVDVTTVPLTNLHKIWESA